MNWEKFLEMLDKYFYCIDGVSWEKHGEYDPDLKRLRRYKAQGEQADILLVNHCDFDPSEYPIAREVIENATVSEDGMMLLLWRHPRMNSTLVFADIKRIPIPTKKD